MPTTSSLSFLEELAQQVGTPTGLLASLDNSRGPRRREWCFVSTPSDWLPADKTELVFVTDRGLRLRAVRDEVIGEHSVLYRVFAPFDAGQSLTGMFVIPKNPPPTIAFKSHPWVNDDLTKLISRVEIRVGNKTYRSGNYDRLEIVHQSPCSVRWAFRARVGASGYVYEGEATFFSNSPVSDLQAAVIWSDPNNPASDHQVDAVFLIAGEPVKFDLATLHSQTNLPVWNGAEWVNLVANNLGTIDGSGFPIVGRMLCLPSTTHSQPSYDPQTYDVNNPEAEVAQDLETIIAAANAPVIGLVHPSAWSGRFLAHKNTPRFDESFEGLEAVVDSRMRQWFQNFATQPGHLYDSRPLGCTKTPGGTGDQQDFGATKGWEAVTAGVALWMPYALYSVLADFFRGFMQYDADGTRWDPSKHPQWVTWSLYTHFNHSVSPDRRGKADTPWGGRSSTGWEAYDEEHRSQHNLAALYALTGWPILRFIIEHASTADIANVRFKLNYGTGAPRAIGRQANCWANFITLFKPESMVAMRYRSVLADLLRQTLRDWYGDKFPGPVKIVYDRTDSRMGITWDGEPLPAWSCWEHGLFCVGVYAAWKVTKDPDWLRLAQEVSRTIVNYAIFKDSTDRWTILSTCHWPTLGQAPNGVTYNPTGVQPSQPIPSQFYSRNTTLMQVSDGGVSTWTQNAVLIFIETHSADDPDMARAQEIAAVFSPANPGVWDPRTAEWAACVRSIPPVPGDYVNY